MEEKKLKRTSSRSSKNSNQQKVSFDEDLNRKIHTTVLSDHILEPDTSSERNCTKVPDSGSKPSQGLPKSNSDSERPKFHERCPYLYEWLYIIAVVAISNEALKYFSDFVSLLKIIKDGNVPLYFSSAILKEIFQFTCKFFEGLSNFLTGAKSLSILLRIIFSLPDKSMFEEMSAFSITDSAIAFFWLCYLYFMALEIFARLKEYYFDQKKKNPNPNINYLPAKNRYFIGFQYFIIDLLYPVSFIFIVLLLFRESGNFQSYPINYNVYKFVDTNFIFDKL